MSSTATKALRNVTFSLLALGLGTGIALAWKRYGGLDPYSSMAKRRRPASTASIQATGVKIRQYKNGKLVGSANVDKVALNADRNGIDLKGIKNGVAQTKWGPATFQAKAGAIRPGLQTVDLKGAVKVGGKDAQGRPYAIQTSQANINGRLGQVTMPQPLKGHIAGGQFAASDLVFRPNSDFASLHKVVWKGQVPQEALPGAKAGARVWEIASEHTQLKGNLIVATDARAEDGEVIVMAPKVEQNRKTDILVATGRATYRSAKADLIADTIVVHRKEKYAEFRGNVIMLVRPKKDWDKPLPKNDVGVQPIDPKLPPELKKGDPKNENISPEEQKRDDALRSGKTLRDYPMNLKADEVTYWYKKGERHAIAKKGDPTAFQRFDDGRWREAKAIQANYDGEKDQLELLGDGTMRQVKLKNSIGDWWDAVWMRLSTKEDQGEDNDDVEAKSSLGHYVSRDDDELGGDKKTVPPPVKTEPPAKSGP